MNLKRKDGYFIMAILDFSKEELNILASELTGQDKAIQETVNSQILNVVKSFDDQFFTKMSGEYAVSVLERLLRGKPITAIFDNDSDWLGSDESTPKNTVFYHKRCHSVHKIVDNVHKTVEYIDYDAVVCSIDGGLNWLKLKDFKGEIENFPYYPPIDPIRIYLKDTGEVDENGNTKFIRLDVNRDSDIIDELYNEAMLKASTPVKKEEKSKTTTSGREKGKKAPSSKTTESKPRKTTKTKSENEKPKTKSSSSPKKTTSKKSTTESKTAEKKSSSTSKKTTTKSTSTKTKQTTVSRSGAAVVEAATGKRTTAKRTTATRTSKKKTDDDK